MNDIKIYKAHFVPHEGIYMTCGEEWPSSRDLHEEEFVNLQKYQELLNEYNELKYRIECLEK